MIAKAAQLAAQMDQLHEYEREPVDKSKLQGAAQFAGLYAGEHVAATEFVIGPFFVLHGVSAADFLWGLLVGNVLAVLSWTLICAPIATRTRLTLYWYLRKIAGPGLTVFYNVVNALLYCVLAGAMISVSASAVGISFGIAPPGAADLLPPNVGWAVLALLIGALFTLLAVLGFVTLSKFATVCAPWLFPIFIAGAVAMLPALGVKPDLSNFWEVAETKIWTGVPSAGYTKFDFWHVVFFAWFANLAMHIGL
ncbi:MAG: hypothetical protein JNK87_37480, partial [Bryobacterales bacterium]|nr:hypothetical protein [Bryobacterales bacterium]